MTCINVCCLRQKENIYSLTLGVPNSQFPNISDVSLWFFIIIVIIIIIIIIIII